MSDRKLRVWWISQIPMSPFYTPVESLAEARKILDVLAKYDLFQYENNVKDDYANAGGLQQFDEEVANNNDPEEDGWCDWWDEETGIDDIEEYFKLTQNE